MSIAVILTFESIFWGACGQKFSGYMFFKGAKTHILYKPDVVAISLL
ncbi:MAG: hypothetical protein LBR22_05665 [Desulfovibrio sp.]|jgi:hypothetical protein|nr:hypothetical protein [Desulfovibrio sp.]